jgi:Tfp pilus assembly protein PilZ
MGTHERRTSVRKYQSGALRGIARLYMAFPIAYPIFFAIFFDLSADHLLRIVLSLFFWIMTVVVVLAGVGLWTMRRWGWYVYILATLLILYKNVQIAFVYGQSQYRTLSVVVGSAILLVAFYRVKSEFYVPYFIPRIRWWETFAKSPFRLRVAIKHQDTKAEEVVGEILDLANSGCFVKTHRSFVQDEKINLTFKLFGNQVSCTGVIVWRALSAVTHPGGIGVMFVDLNKSQKRLLGVLTSRIRKVENLKQRFSNHIEEKEIQENLENKRFSNVIRDLKSLESDES